MKLATLQVLSDGEIEAIHRATLEILGQCGVRLLSPRMLERLAAKGIRTDPDRRLAFFTPADLEEALAAAPPRFEVFDRDGRPAFSLGDGVPRIAAGHNAVFWVDSDTGETRPSRVADVELFARLCEGLEGIDMIGIPVMPQDVPRSQGLPAARGAGGHREQPQADLLLHRQAARQPRGIEMCRAAFAGDLAAQVYGITQLSPTSPLFWEEGVLEAILDTLGTGVPLAILPEPIAGVSAPYTLAGLLTMNNAECLSGLAMIQLLAPGHEGAVRQLLDRQRHASGAALVGSIETTLCRIAGAQLARFYRVPSHTTAPNSDNHAHDEQNAWEKTFSAFCAVAAGNDLIVNCGMFATGMTCSHEQLLMDEEISACSRRLAAGIEVTPATIAADLIRQRGPQGETYLTAEHTLERLRSGEYLAPRLSVSGLHALWAARGAKDTYQLARDRVRGLAGREAPPFEEGRRRALADILSRFSR